MLDCAIIGTGPAALAAATRLTAAGIKPILFERRPAPGWKLLVAGSSGLNVTYDCPDEELVSHYSSRRNEMGHCLQRYPRATWLELLTSLGEEPYVGSSHRYFLRNKTAATLLNTWTERLEQAGAEFRYGEDLVGLTADLTLTFASGKSEQARSVLLAFGGGSWEDSYPAWPELLKGLGLEGSKLLPSNAGYSFHAPEGFFEKAEGKPIKGLTLSTTRGKRQGELMITKYGLEGTPVYTVGCSGPAVLDLKPDLAEDKLAQKIASGKGAMLSRIENSAKLSPGALLILKALAYPRDFESPVSAAKAIKHLDIELLESRPLSESISASGGLSWSELGKDLEAKKVPGLFAAGEMVDWDAPTGGFLIQGAVSMGFVASDGILKHLQTIPEDKAKAKQ
jgi:uncharacterized flavoprotein (TIGR03862 family)